MSSRSFLARSFSKSSARRRRSRTLRSMVSCFSLRTSGERSWPFFSRSSLSLASSLCSVSTCFCMAALSRSRASRAETPAADLAITRWVSMKPTRGAAAAGGGDWASAGGGVHRTPTPHAAVAARTTTGSTTLSITRIVLPPSVLERGAHREVELPHALVGSAVQLDAVVAPERAERRGPAQRQPRVVAQLPQVEHGSEARVRTVHLPYIVKESHANVEKERNRVFDGAEDLDVPPDLGPGLVHRGDLARLPAPEGIGPAQVVALEEGDGIAGPADRVGGQGSAADHVVQPGVVEAGEVAGGAHELAVAEEQAREVDPDAGHRAPRG